MEVILLQDIKSLGKSGGKIKVKDGYARNYLFPNKLASPCTKAALEALKIKKNKETKDAEKKKKISLDLAGKIAALSVTISAESGVDDMLFGSVTPDNILNALRQEGVDIDKKCITISEPIRKLGVYNVEIKLHPEVKQELRVWVVKK